MDTIPITRNGHDTLSEELHELKSVQRPAVIKAIAEARAHGDLSENAEYHAAREKQSFIEGRIVELEAILSRAQVIDPEKTSSETIVFGATVELEDCDSEETVSYALVGEAEANINRGLLSIQAPLARALLGKSEGDVFDLTTPRGKRTYEIIKVSYVPIKPA